MLIADDDDLMRVGLRGVLASDPSIDVVGEAKDGRDALTAPACSSPRSC